VRAIALVALLVTSAAAQPGPRVGPPGPSVSAENARDKIKDQIRAMRAARLVARLRLDEKTATRLVPALDKFDDEFEKLLVARAELQKKIANAPKDDRVADRLVDEALANQRAFRDVEERRLAELRKILTPAQFLKLINVLPQVEQHIRNEIQKAIQRGPTDDDDLVGSPKPAPPPQRQVKPPGRPAP
jgi:hypothetical protein